MSFREKIPLPPDAMMLSFCRVFLLVGIFLIGHATYKLYEYTEFENQQGDIKIMFDVNLYVQLYESGGKWYVFAFLCTLAAICFIASGFTWRKVKTIRQEMLS